MKIKTVVVGLLYTNCYIIEDEVSGKCAVIDPGGAYERIFEALDGKKHVGLRNVRGRLQAMVNGELLLESAPGAGTKATILIPKEVTA